VFWVISVYFNIRNTLPNSGTFLLGHPVYIYIYIYICRDMTSSFWITHNDAPNSIGLFWTSEQLFPETIHNTHNKHPCPHPPVGFEPTIPAGERTQIHELYREATGTSFICTYISHYI